MQAKYRTIKDVSFKKYDDVVDMMGNKLSLRDYNLYTDGYRDCLKDMKQLAEDYILWIQDRDTMYSGHIALVHCIEDLFGLEKL